MILTVGMMILIVVMLAFTIQLYRKSGSDKQQMQIELQSVRVAAEQSIRGVTCDFSTQLQAMSSHVQGSLADATLQLGARLDAMNRQVTEQLNQSANLMNRK